MNNDITSMHGSFCLTGVDIAKGNSEIYLSNCADTHAHNEKWKYNEMD